MGGGRGGHLNIWAIIFMLVTLQMTTTLRPIIGESESGKFLNLEEKRFFIPYWFEVMEGESTSTISRADRASEGASPVESRETQTSNPGSSAKGKKAASNPYLDE
jgi:hypothetical protein